MLQNPIYFMLKFRIQKSVYVHFFQILLCNLPIHSCNMQTVTLLISTKSIITYPDILQENLSSPLVLNTHELFCMLVLFFGLGAKELSKIR